MTAIVWLIVAALILIFFEVLLPGGILGLIAAGCIIVATAIGVQEYGVVAGAGIFIGSMVACLILTVIEFKIFAKSKYGRRFFLSSSQQRGDGDPPGAPEPDSVVGKTGEALTRLNPSGKIALEGKSFEAWSRDGYIDAGTKVKVLSRDTFKLIVKSL